ncbi:MAG TPA: MBL fold metallo-hydrolase, partial [Noviherbaspirillum sp.]
DQLVQQKLNRDIPIVSTGEAIKTLKELGFKSLYELDTWHSLRVTKGEATLRISAMPARHGPPGAAVALPETMGSMLEFSRDGKPGYRIYISGDTLIYDELKQIRERYPDIDLALLHLGGTRILGVVKVTMDGEDGVELMQIVVPRHAIPIHYNDYDVFKSPLSDFQKAVQQAGLQDKVTYLAHGERYRFKSRPR